jgi:diacylglycerol kinase family enzyme
MNFYINALTGRRVPWKKKQVEIKPDAFMSGKTPRIGVIVNPLSGGNLSGLGEIRKAIADYPTVLSRDVETPEDIAAALSDFARKRVNLLAVNGGDGTVQAVLTNLFHHQPFKTLPMLAVLQSGTTSMTARDVGFSGSRVKSLRKLFKWGTTAEGEPQEIQRPVLQVEAPGHPPRYGMFFGASAIYQGIQYFHSKVNTKGLKGEIGPGLTILRFLWAALSQRSNFIPPVPITVELDDQPPRQFDSFVVLVSTLERLFLGLYPYWGRESGPLHYTALRAQPQNLLRALPSILRGRQSSYATPQNGFYSNNAHEIKLNLDSGFTLDGQLYTPETRQEPTVVRYGGTASFLRI